MIDDEDTHIRRNIVVVSTGILLAAYLELPVSWFLASFMPKENPVIEQYKYWGMGFAILLYLGLRYRFSNEGGEAAGSINKEAARIRHDRMRRRLHLPQNNELEYIRLKEMFPEIDSYIEETRRSHQLDGGYRAINPSANIQALNVRAPNQMSALINLKFPIGNGSPAEFQMNRQPVFTWSPVRAFFLFGLPAHVQAVLYSSSAIKNLAPLVLAIAAEAILLARLVMAFWRA